MDKDDNVQWERTSWFEKWVLAKVKENASTSSIKTKHRREK